MKSLPLKKFSPFAAVLVILLQGLSLTAQAGFFDAKPTGFGSRSAEGFLPVEEAFRLEGRLEGSDLILIWHIQPGHYLYRSRFQATSVLPEGISLLPVNIPDGEKVDDAFQGRVEILRNTTELSYQFSAPADELKLGAVVDVVFQGCAEEGLCYPPHRQRLNLIQK